MSYTTETSALKMPNSYMLMDEEEMMYTESGYSKYSEYYNSRAEAVNACDLNAYTLYRLAAKLDIAATTVGGCMGGLFGAAIGLIGGILASNVIFGFASAWDSAGIDARKIPRTARGCIITQEINILNMRVTVA